MQIIIEMEEQKLKKTLKGYLIGFLSAIFIIGCVTAFAANTTTLYDVIVDGVKIVLDGKEFTCTDANGTVVQPMIYNGTTYIPVRAVSSAFGKAVYWDGDNKTVYLGNMDGKLEEPTLKLEDIENIAGDRYRLETAKNIFENYGSFYDSAVYNGRWADENDCCETLLNKKFSKFKATLFVPKGADWREEHTIKIIGDGKVISPEIIMNKTSEPIDIEIPITDVNNFKIIFDGNEGIHIANGGFYQ